MASSSIILNLFIDSNIYLGFYHLSKNDLQSLKTLAVYVENKEINLIVTTHVIDEVRRNREKVINDAIESVKNLPSDYPEIFKNYSEFAEFTDAVKTYNKIKNKIVEKIKRDASENKINADVLIERIFKAVKPLHYDSKVVEVAKQRYDLGNPPGKGRSYGDALNWTILMKQPSYNGTLYFIADDKDYYSPIDPEQPNHFLSTEWKASFKKDIRFYKSLAKFFKEKGMDIKLADELEKELLIENLKYAGSFASARKYLTRLSEIGNFTEQQLNEIITIAVTNRQLKWIANDTDISEILNDLVLYREQEIEPDILKQFNELFENEELESQGDL